MEELIAYLCSLVRVLLFFVYVGTGGGGASDCVIAMHFCIAARISNSVFPSAPPVRRIEDGGAFISLERVVVSEGLRVMSSPERMTNSSSKGR